MLGTPVLAHVLELSSLAGSWQADASSTTEPPSAGCPISRPQESLHVLVATTEILAVFGVKSQGPQIELGKRRARQEATVSPSCDVDPLLARQGKPCGNSDASSISCRDPMRPVWADEKAGQKDGHGHRIDVVPCPAAPAFAKIALRDRRKSITSFV